jgi:homeobox protein YOX1/YHP1
MNHIDRINSIVNSYQASHQICYDDQVDPRYTSAPNSNYPSRMTPPLHGDTHGSRRAPQFSVANAGSDRWQSAASYTPISGQMPVRSHAAAYPAAYPSYNAPHSSYSYPPIPDPRAIPQPEPYLDQIHMAQAAAVDRSGMTRAERNASSYARSSAAAAPYPQPPASPTEETPQVKKKRKRADAAQLEILNEVYNRTAFPSTEERAELARKLDMTPRSVQIW